MYVSADDLERGAVLTFCFLSYFSSQVPSMVPKSIARAQPPSPRLVSTHSGKNRATLRCSTGTLRACRHSRPLQIPCQITERFAYSRAARFLPGARRGPGWSLPRAGRAGRPARASARCARRRGAFCLELVAYRAGRGTGPRSAATIKSTLVTGGYMARLAITLKRYIAM